MNTENITDRNEQIKAYFSHKWEGQAREASYRTKEQLWKAYIAHILGCGKDTAENFAKGMGVGWEVVEGSGLLESEEADFSGFWEEVNSSLVEEHPEEEIDYLSREGGIESVRNFMNHFKDSSVYIALSSIASEDNKLLYETA